MKGSYFEPGDICEVQKYANKEFNGELVKVIGYDSCYPISCHITKTDNANRRVLEPICCHGSSLRYVSSGKSNESIKNGDFVICYRDDFWNYGVILKVIDTNFDKKNKIFKGLVIFNPSNQCPTYDVGEISHTHKCYFSKISPIDCSIIQNWVKINGDVNQNE